MLRACSARRMSWWRARTARASSIPARAISEMKRRSHRPERLSELIRQAVGAFLTGDVRDPRIGFVTVTGVEVSPDLSHANVRVSVMGSDEEKATSLEGLASAARYLRAQLSKELRTSPELHFHLDRGIEHAQHIDRVLKELKESDD